MELLSLVQDDNDASAESGGWAKRIQKPVQALSTTKPLGVTRPGKASSSKVPTPSKTPVPAVKVRNDSIFGGFVRSPTGLCCGTNAGRWCADAFVSVMFSVCGVRMDGRT